MKLKPDQLAASLKRGLAPVYLIAGDEPLLVQECCDQVRAAAREQGFIERELLQVERGFDWSELQQVAAPSLFASQKIIDLRLRTGKPGKEGGRCLKDWAAAPDPNVILMVSCEEWDKSSRNSKWAKNLAQAGQYVDIWPIKVQEMPRWLEQRMRSHGMQADPEALRILVERLQGNLLAARQEVDRLALLKGTGVISVEDILQAVADSSRFDGFQLAEHMLNGNLKDGLRVAAGLRRMDEPLPWLVGALLRELKIAESFRLAMRAGEQESTVFRRLNVWQNRQYTIRAAARRISTLKFYEAFKLLALTDRQIKGRAPGNPWQSIDQLLLQLSNQQ